MNPRSSPFSGRVKSNFDSFYTRVLITVIESGAIYSVALILEIALYLINSNAFYIVYDPIAQLTVSYLIFILLLTKFTKILPGADAYIYNRLVNSTSYDG